VRPEGVQPREEPINAANGAARSAATDAANATARPASAASFDELVRQSGLGELAPGAALADVGARLDALGKLAKGADAPTLALVREEAIRIVKAIGCSDAPAKLVDANLPRGRSGLGGDAEKQGGAVLFPQPNPWPEALSTIDVLTELVAAVTAYVILPAEAVTAIGLWILHTHALDSAQITPRLAILSPLKRCGKSTLLKLLATLVHRPLPTANLTAAALFRIVEAHAPTLLIDEADTFMHDNEALRGVLNAGHDLADGNDGGVRR